MILAAMGRPAYPKTMREFRDQLSSREACLGTGRGRIESSLIEIASRHPLEFSHEVSVTITSVIQVDTNSNPLRILSVELSIGRGAAEILRQYP